MKSLVVSLEQLARVGAVEADLHRLCAPLLRSSSTVYSAPTRRATRARRSRGDLAGRALALGALADVDVDAPAVRVDTSLLVAAVSGIARASVAAALHLELGVVRGC